MLWKQEIILNLIVGLEKTIIFFFSTVCDHLSGAYNCVYVLVTLRGYAFHLLLPLFFSSFADTGAGQ